MYKYLGQVIQKSFCWKPSNVVSFQIFLKFGNIGNFVILEPSINHRIYRPTRSLLSSDTVSGEKVVEGIEDHQIVQWDSLAR